MKETPVAITASPEVSGVNSGGLQIGGRSADPRLA